MNAFTKMMERAGTHPPLGTWLMSASPVVIEAMGCAGFEWGVVDMEHSPLDLTNLIQLLQAAAGTPMLTVTRVPWNDTVTIKRVLDAGATTLLVPYVQNADEARRAVEAARYAPEGVRGLAGMSRGSRFGTAANYFKTANAGITVIVQLETPQAVDELEAIAATPGLGGLFMGPADLSASMGYVGQLTHPEVQKVMANAARRARAAGLHVGTVGGTPEVVREYREMGFDFVAIASDLGLMMRAATGAVQALKAEATPATAAPTPQGY